MTLHQSVRHPFARALANLRQEWDQAGTDAAIAKLSQRIGDPGRVLEIALATALNPAARLPEAMLHHDKIPQPIAAAGPLPPLNLCPDHPKSGLRLNGECAGCWVDRTTGDVIEFRRTGGTPAPENFRDLVAAARASRDDQGDEANG